MFHKIIPKQYSWIQKAAAGIICSVSLLFFFSLNVSAETITEFEGKTFVEKEGEMFLKVDKKLFKIVPDVVTVKFQKSISAADKSSLYSAHTTKAIRTNRLGYVDIKVPAGKSALEFVIELKNTGMFESVEVNTFGEYEQTIPNDPRFTDQWGLNNTGQTGGTVDADIDAPEAWDIISGGNNVIVAVVDSGTDVDHEDLECNIWVNPGEDFDGDGVVWDTDDLNGIDDDGNGLIDDIVGWDFNNGDNDPRSTNAHGTHVAGIVGACGNNTTGVIGVAGGVAPGAGALLMPLGVGEAAPNGAVLDDAILYAADMGATIITMSLTVGSSAAIDAALASAYGDGLFINNASGNDNAGVGYPATDPNVVAVGATNHDDNRATPANTGSWGSNFGPELEVVAPGVDIWSTRPGNNYNTGGGTSYASPHVAGLAALMFAANPSATNAEVRQCITDTAEDQVGDPAEDIAGRDDHYGHGRINAEAAVECILPNLPPVCDADGPYQEECAGATTVVTLDGTGSSDPDPLDVLSYSWSTTCPGGSFDDATAAMPELSVDSSSGVTVVCNAGLVVTDDDGASDSCTSTVTVSDTTPPSITCPLNSTIECDVTPDPAVTGTASSTDVCDDSPDITFSDTVSPGTCSEESTITRTWTATDASGNSSSCAQTIEVVDTTPPVISCNAPATITPPDAPISFTGTATDNCAADPSVEVIGYDCFKFTKKGKRIDKTESCVVQINGDSITIVDSGGVNDNITWTVRASDNCGNVSEATCSVVVVNPGKP